MNFKAREPQKLIDPAMTPGVAFTNKRSLYYRRGGYTRVNKWKENWLTTLLMLGSYPRLLIEVFIRSNFGERYIGSHAVITCFILALFVPMGLECWFFHRPIGEVLTGHYVWYGYLLAFLVIGLRRCRETRSKPGVFDFARYSKSNGVLYAGLTEMWRWIWDSLFKKEPSPRTMEIYLEPLPFMVLGIIGWFIDPLLGGMLMFCAFVYWGSFSGEYSIGDEFIMDLIDEQIMAEQTHNIMVGGASPEDAKGVNFRFKKPTDGPMNAILADRMLDDGEAPAAVY